MNDNEQKAFNATGAGQKAMSGRASRIATLISTNEAIRRLDPKEAWGRGFLDNTPDSQIDAMLETVVETFNRVTKLATAKVNLVTPTTNLPCGCAHHGILAGCPVHSQQATQAPKTIQEHNAFPEGRFTSK